MVDRGRCGLVYLGFLDTSFDIEQHVYNVLNAQAWEEIVINLYSFIFDLVSVVYGFLHDRMAAETSMKRAAHSHGQTVGKGENIG